MRLWSTGTSHAMSTGSLKWQSASTSLLDSTPPFWNITSEYYSIWRTMPCYFQQQWCQLLSSTIWWHSLHVLEKKTKKEKKTHTKHVQTKQNTRQTKKTVEKKTKLWHCSLVILLTIFRSCPKEKRYGFSWRTACCHSRSDTSPMYQSFSYSSR